MRGKIIHYNGGDGKGLVAADGRQFAFSIDQWRSDSAPAVNQTVELVIEGDTLQSLARVSDEALLKERANELAGRLGGMGGAALGSLKSASPGAAEGLQGGVARLGKPLLVIHALFALAALFFAYIKITPPFGGSVSYSLVGLSGLSEQLGGSVGGALLPWLAILSIGLPVFWRSRWAWLALLLPLLATIKPMLDVFAVTRKVSAGVGQIDAGMARMMREQMMDMLGTGMGLWLCLATSLALAAFAVKRALLPPADAPLAAPAAP